MSETRRLLDDMYGLKGTFAQGQVVDHLPVGSIVTLTQGERGHELHFKGRVYPLNFRLQYEARQKSEPA